MIRNWSFSTLRESLKTASMLRITKKAKIDPFWSTPSQNISKKWPVFSCTVFRIHFWFLCLERKSSENGGTIYFMSTLSFSVLKIVCESKIFLMVNKNRRCAQSHNTTKICKIKNWKFFWQNFRDSIEEHRASLDPNHPR